MQEFTNEEKRIQIVTDHGTQCLAKAIRQQLNKASAFVLSKWYAYPYAYSPLPPARKISSPRAGLFYSNGASTMKRWWTTCTDWEMFAGGYVFFAFFFCTISASCSRMDVMPFGIFNGATIWRGMLR